MNSQKLLQGHSDAALSEVGIEQAKKLGRCLSSTTFTAAYASDLQRAYNTAKLILRETSTGTIPEITKDLRLRERGYGDAEGKPVQDFLKRAAEAKVGFNDFVPNGGESMPDLVKRVGEFFDTLCKLSHKATSTEHVLVVSHGGWINCLMRYMNDHSDKFELQDFSASQAIRIHHNTGVTVFSIDNKGPADSPKYKVHFSKINNASHLAEDSFEKQ